MSESMQKASITPSLYLCRVTKQHGCFDSGKFTNPARESSLRRRGFKIPRPIRTFRLRSKNNRATYQTWSNRSSAIYTDGFPTQSGNIGAFHGISLRQLCGRELREQRRVELRSCHVLWRIRCLRHHGGCVRVRKPVQPRVRHRHGCTEHRVVQQRDRVRCVLRDPLRGRPPVVSAGQPVGGNHGNKLLPPELRAARQRRRVVQPATRALRHGHARVRADRHLEGRHRPDSVQESEVPEGRRAAFYRKRELLFLPRSYHQRGFGRRRGGGEDKGVQDGVGVDDQKLGPKLAVQHQSDGATPILRSYDQRRKNGHVVQRGSLSLAVWADL